MFPPLLLQTQARLFPKKLLRKLQKPLQKIPQKIPVLFLLLHMLLAFECGHESPVKQNQALIDKLKADADARVSQLRGIVEKMMTKQGAAIGQADDMWKFLASGKYTVSAEVKAQAQKDIAEDGYWGVAQTSDRILDFAKALSGNDPEKADELLEAFKKGFKQATGAWGKDLPDISKRTYDAVVEKFNNWKNGAEDKSSTSFETE